MNITSLGENEGMLFCYPKEQELNFWMKSTPIPLSIAFIDKDKVITQIEELYPYDESGIKTNKNTPAKWALEVNSGWFEKNNIKVGQKVDIPFREVKIRVLG